MIDDGYTELFQRGEWWAYYRPMLPRERATLRRDIDSLPEDACRAVVIRAIHGRVVEGNLPPIGLLNQRELKVVWRALLGCGRGEEQMADARNLREGVAIHLRHPHLTTTSCESCKHWWYDPLKGELAKRDGQPLKRVGGVLCESGKCPVGHWSNPKRLSEKNMKAFRHWQECRATGQFPNDAIVRRNAAIIQAVYDKWQVSKR